MKLLKKLLTLLIVLAMIGLGMMFSTANDMQVPLDFLLYTFAPKSLALWILLAFALGGILGMAASSLLLLGTRTSLRTSRKQLDRSREEVSKLRAGASAANPS
ncbi:MAG: putative membrane protein [Bacteroidia bacterium]|jgi:putative membrane protein